MTTISTVDRSTILKEGLNAGWPICLGYLPIGMAFGVLAQKAGLTPFQIGLMSIMVFAGSAQFIAISMLASNRLWSATMSYTCARQLATAFVMPMPGGSLMTRSAGDVNACCMVHAGLLAVNSHKAL